MALGRLPLLVGSVLVLLDWPIRAGILDAGNGLDSARLPVESELAAAMTGDGPPKYWPPYEERQALRRRLRWFRPLQLIIACVLAAFFAYAIWLKISGS
jgi:hypothetical protein